MRRTPSRAALAYLTTLSRCAAVSGLVAEEAAGLAGGPALRALDAPRDTLDHTWAPHDVVIWDNACVLHRADHSGVVGDRVMHRGMVADHAVPA